MSGRNWLILLPALAVAGFLSLWASEAPDGLETALRAQGVPEGLAVVPAPMPEYELSLLGRPWLRRTVAGISGALATAALVLAVGRLVARKKGTNAPSPH